MSDRSRGVSTACPRIRISGFKDNRPLVTAEEVRGLHRDPPVIRLSIRKPRSWGWQLTTSTSSPSVAAPVVCLVDDNGNVLAQHEGESDANINRLVHCRSLTSSEGAPSPVGRPTPLDLARIWNEKRANRDTSSAESEVSRRPRRKQDSGYKSLRRNRELEGSGCKDSRTDTGNSSLRVEKDSQKDSGNTSLRRRKDTGSASSRRSTSTASSRSGRRKHRDNNLGPRPRTEDTSDTDVRLTPPRHDDDTGSSRRPRRRQRSSDAVNAMGSNVSRQGLSGRRTQSSGNLCNGNKILARDVGRILASCSDNAGQKDRSRFCGSLPNYLDGEYAGNELDDHRCCNNNNNNNNNNSVATSSMKAQKLQEQKRGLELRLLPQQDLAQQDQGYASERSPEDEHPPPLPPPEPPLEADGDPLWCLTQHYPFITPDALFEVTLLKGNRGLGLSVTGGVETGEQWPGLIRIKRLFPHQPAWQSGQLASGDILLAANGVPLTGLTNYQALEVLRTSPSTVVLEMCRPPNNVFCVAVPTEPPVPPRRDVSCRMSSSHLVAPLPLLQIEEPSGEFDIVLKKVNRSLGFTLRKEDESVLGHYVRALVREPALSDGRIRPGDKIVEVNDVPLSPMSHEEAVAFLRQCGETVKLRLYRDAAQTPVAALSPTESEPPSCMRPRPMLRQEARDMLSDLAVRKLSPTNSSSSTHGGLLQCMSSGSTPGTSPRRRRLTKTPPPDVTVVAREKLGYYHTVSSHNEDSESSSIARGEGADVPDLRDCSNTTLPQRPQFLNLQNDNSPQSSRKQKYTFAVPEPVQLDSCDELHLPTHDTSHGYPSSEDNGGLLMEPTSLPPLSSTSSTSTAFSYRNPAYHSANPIKSADEETMTECLSDQDLSGKVFDEQAGGTCSLLKWKGVVFTPQNGANNSQSGVNNFRNDGSYSQITGTGGGSTGTQPENGKILVVELNRGWNSRLGFSLQSHGSRTYVSAVYADSVAARDGRIKAYDQLLTVNDENVENMTTAEIIDLLRKIRGTIEIRVLRKSGPNHNPS